MYLLCFVLTVGEMSFQFPAAVTMLAAYCYGRLLALRSSKPTRNSSVSCLAMVFYHSRNMTIALFINSVILMLLLCYVCHTGEKLMLRQATQLQEITDQINESRALIPEEGNLTDKQETRVLPKGAPVQAFNWAITV